MILLDMDALIAIEQAALSAAWEIPGMLPEDWERYDEWHELHCVAELAAATVQALCHD